MVNQLDSMIDDCKNLNDISKIMLSGLFSLNELKLLCKNKINNSNINNYTLRKSYINCQSIDDLLGNDLMVKILKYINTKEYSKYPILSKSFKVK